MDAPTSKTPVPVARGDNPVRDLQKDVNRLFNDFFGDLAFPAWDRFSTQMFAPHPAVDITESDKAYTLTAELPVLDSKDVQVTVADGYLTLKGEKSQETKSEGKDFYRRERTYGSFQRVIELPKDADFEHTKAEMKNGLLTVTVARKVEDAKSRKIDIREVA